MGPGSSPAFEGRSPDNTITPCPAGMPTHVCLDLTQEHRVFQQSSCVVIRELQLHSLTTPVTSSAACTKQFAKPKQGLPSRPSQGNSETDF